MQKIIPPNKDPRIERFIFNPVKKVLSEKLKNIIYYDTSDLDLMSDSSNGIHIIANEVELKFENGKSLFISWISEKEWEQYALGCSKRKFTEDPLFKYSLLKNKNWNDYINDNLIDFHLWGYQKYKVSEKNLFKEHNDYFINQPHLLELSFQKKGSVFFANFHTQDNFNPKFPIGDDIWIIFNKKLTLDFIEYFSFDKFI